MTYGLRISGGDDCGSLDHENDRRLGGTRAVNDALGHDVPVPGSQVHGAVFQINDEMAVETEEELVVVVVLVPVILALQHPQPNDRVVDSAQRLVVPAIGA